jgi:hypothetical protein
MLYLGLTVPGFPNLFVTCGPNSGLSAAHTTLSEQQVCYIVESLQALVDNDLSSMEVRAEACTAYNDDLQREMQRTVWLNGGTAHGYYKHRTGRIVLGYPYANVRYWQALRRPDLADYDLTPAGAGADVHTAELAQ